MAPVTWRNVNAPDFSRASLSGQLAANSFNNALSSLKDVGDVFARKDERGLELNSENFKEILRQRYQTPEALEQGRASGEIDALRSEYSRLDPKLTNSLAVDKIHSALRDDVRADNAYAASQLAEQDRLTNVAGRGDLNAFNQALSLNTQEGLNQARDILVNKDVQANETPLFGLLSQGQRGLEKENRARQNYANDQTLFRQRIDKYNYELDQRNLKDEIRNYASDSFNKFEEGRKGYENKIKPITNSIAKLLGGRNPQDLNDAELEQLQGLNTQLSGIAKPKSTENFLDSLRAEVLRKGGSLEQAGAVANLADQYNLGINQPDALTQQEKQLEVAALKNKYADVSAVQHYLSKQPVSEAIASLLADEDIARQLSNDWFKEPNQRDFLYAAMTEGVDTKAGKVVLPPSVIKIMLLNTNQENWFDRSPEEVLNHYIDKQGVSDEIHKLAAFQREEAELNSKYNRKKNNPTAVVNFMESLNIDAIKESKAAVKALREAAKQEEAAAERREAKAFTDTKLKNAQLQAELEKFQREAYDANGIGNLGGDPSIYTEEEKEQIEKFMGR